MQKVLLVTDDDTEIENSRDIVTYMGIQLYTADSPAEAKLFFDAVRPNLVIVDVEMTDAIGFEVIESLRSTTRTSYVVATTRGDHQDLWAIAGFACGADAYVVGPMTAPKLKDVMSGSVSCDTGR